MKRRDRRFIPASPEPSRMTDPDHELRLEIVTLLPRLRRLARALAGSHADGDDLLQTACEKALARLHQFERGTRLDRWMFQILRTTHIDRLRRVKRRRQADLTPDLADILPFDARIHEQTEAREDLAVIRSEVARLPEEQREVLVLVVLDGLSYQDAAETLGVPQGTVMSRLARARRKLAHALESRRPRNQTEKDALHGPRH
jgi:RNA polymerase sigma-70 factor (ECF subfamily)